MFRLYSYLATETRQTIVILYLHPRFRAFHVSFCVSNRLQQNLSAEF